MSSNSTLLIGQPMAAEELVAHRQGETPCGNANTGRLNADSEIATVPLTLTRVDVSNCASLGERPTAVGREIQGAEPSNDVPRGIVIELTEVNREQQEEAQPARQPNTRKIPTALISRVCFGAVAVTGIAVGATLLARSGYAKEAFASDRMRKMGIAVGSLVGGIAALVALCKVCENCQILSRHNSRANAMVAPVNENVPVADRV